jgi:hypothetical protein
MPYQRKTKDEWQMWADHGYGWEHELTEDTWKAMREQLRTYRLSQPDVAFRAVKRRVKLTACGNCGHGEEWHVLDDVDHPRFGDCEHADDEGGVFCKCPGYLPLEEKPAALDAEQIDVALIAQRGEAR